MCLVFPTIVFYITKCVDEDSMNPTYRKVKTHLREKSVHVGLVCGDLQNIDVIKVIVK